MSKEKKSEYIIQLKAFGNIAKALRTNFSMYYIYNDGYIYGSPTESSSWRLSVAVSTKPITMYQNLIVNAVDIYEKVKDLKMTLTEASEKANIITLSDTRNNVEPAVFYRIDEDIDTFIDRSIDKPEVYRYLIDKKNLNADDYIKIPQDGVTAIVNGMMYEHDEDGYYFRLTKDVFPHIKKDTTIEFRKTATLPSNSPRYNRTYITLRTKTPSLNIDIYSIICIRTVNT